MLPKWVKRACKAFGRPLPKVDLFAGRHNTSAPAYFASHEDGGSGLLGVNALAHPWQELKDPYANPPWSLMADVIHKVIRDKVKSIIVVAPVWRGATWWPLLNRLTKKSYNIPQNEAVFSTELQSALLPLKWRRTSTSSDSDAVEPKYACTDEIPPLEVLKKYYDMPIQQKLRIMREHYGEVAAEDEKKRHKKRVKRAKYHDFPYVARLFRMVVDNGMAENVSLTVLRDSLIVALRIVTMARDYDLANCLPAIYGESDKSYLKWMAKGDVERTCSITGEVLQMTRSYVQRAKVWKGDNLLQFQDGSHRSLGSRRLATITA